MIRYHVERQYDAADGKAFATVLDATFQEAEYSATMLQLANMVEGLQGMFAGDRIRLYVGSVEAGVWGFTYDAVVKRQDADLREIGRELEHRA